jgi:hypothetical protein
MVNPSREFFDTVGIKLPNDICQKDIDNNIEMLCRTMYYIEMQTGKKEIPVDFVNIIKYYIEQNNKVKEQKNKVLIASCLFSIIILDCSILFLKNNQKFKEAVLIKLDEFIEKSDYSEFFDYYYDMINYKCNE